MDYQFRDEVKNAKKAAMGEMYHLAKENMKPEDKLINFASGHPATEVFPNEYIRRYIDRALEEGGKNLLQYGPHAGDEYLRWTMKKFINEKGDNVKPKDDLIITYGATEGIFLTGIALINKGDYVIVEEPTYVNAIKSFEIIGANVVSVPLEKDGVDLNILENIMKNGVKIYYTIPNFNNPTGITTSQKKRRAIYELAVKYNVVIVEDDTYGNLRYKGERIPNIKEYDKTGNVVYLSSMSKIIAPTARIGLMVANKKFINKIITIKAVSSNGVSTILQRAFNKLFEENDMDAEIQKICNLYSQKLNVMEESIRKYFPSRVKYLKPDGGMFIWVTMPDRIDIEQFCRQSATELHIPITPGKGFCVNNPEKCTSLRFNFVKENIKDIDEGIREVGKLMNKFLSLN